MAKGISIKDVENKVQNINDNNVIPLSTGADVPEVVTVGVLKEHINEDVETALEGKQDVISDLATIRSGAALGATAIQVESDPTVPAWAKEAQKPSYSYSEITGKPTLSAVATSGSYNDLTNKPTIPVVPTNVSAFTNDAGYLTEHQDISGKANSEDLATVAFSGDYEDLTNTPTIPDVPEWAMSSTKPSYTVSEISGAQEELESGVNIKTINGTSILGSGNITIQGGGGGGDVNVIESITFNGSAVPVDGNKNASITYTAPVASVNGNTGAITLSASDVGALPDTTSIPTELTVSGWGFTKNAGTVTSVTVNGSTYSPTNGDVDLGTIGGGGGTSVQADWAQTDSTASDFIKNKPSASNFYYAAWTASSSAASAARLTNTLVLPEGIYILNGRYPVLNKSLLATFSLTNIKTSANQSNQNGLTAFQGGSYLPIVEILFVGPGGGEIYLQSAQSTAVTYTYLDRGYISAIKIA